MGVEGEEETASAEKKSFSEKMSPGKSYLLERMRR